MQVYKYVYIYTCEIVNFERKIQFVPFFFVGGTNSFQHTSYNMSRKIQFKQKYFHRSVWREIFS